MKLGIIAGAGDLPKYTIEYLHKKGQNFFVVGLMGSVDYDLTPVPHKILPIGKTKAIINSLKEQAVTEVILLGKVKKPLISELKLDLNAIIHFLPLVRKLKSQGDDNLLKAVIKFVEKFGFKVVGVKNVCPQLLAPKGFLTRIKANTKEIKDIHYAKEVLDHLSPIDIGQSIIVQNLQVIAVEAREGTDQMILRSKDLLFQNPKQKAILVKMPKIKQDLRVDMPTIGINTIENLYKSGIYGLAIASDNTIFLNQSEAIQKANQYGIFIYGI